jgi:hypothetical protein
VADASQQRLRVMDIPRPSEGHEGDVRRPGGPARGSR